MNEIEATNSCLLAQGGPSFAPFHNSTMLISTKPMAAFTRSCSLFRKWYKVSFPNSSFHLTHSLRTCHLWRQNVFMHLYRNHVIIWTFITNQNKAINICGEKATGPMAACWNRFFWWNNHERIIMASNHPHHTHSTSFFDITAKENDITSKHFTLKQA